MLRGKGSIVILVREKLKGAEIDVRNSENVLTVNTLGPIKRRTNTPALSLGLGLRGAYLVGRTMGLKKVHTICGPPTTNLHAITGNQRTGSGTPLFHNHFEELGGSHKTATGALASVSGSRRRSRGWWHLVEK